MKEKLVPAALLLGLMALASCSSHYVLAGVERSRILVDSMYDVPARGDVDAFMSPYRQRVDSVMGPVVGRAAKYMAASRPESPLSNLLADILVWSGRDYGEEPDFAVYNMGGMRAALAEGDITLGDILDVAPFENRVCFVTLGGDKVLELFGQIAFVGGEAVSRGVELVVSKDHELVSARLFGREIDPAARYRVATIDYVAQGNDYLGAFKASTDVNSPGGEENNVRCVIAKYIGEATARGVAVSAEIEGRITVLDR